MEAIIKISQVMTEGGCNACVPFALQILTMQLENGREYALEKLDCGALIMPIAQINHWQTRLFLADEEGLIYQKNTQEVHFSETFYTDCFATKEQVITCPKKISEPDVFAQTNHILTTLFKIKPVTFILKKQENDLNL